ncbi:unnamed protein product [Closterium sp. NIES-64]|nr:unnamed protein product [Closterium sp. NIES-64]
MKSRGLICIIGQNDTAPVLVEVVDSKTTKKTGTYLSELIRTAICKVGDKKVVQVVMDNASNNKSAAAKLEPDIDLVKRVLDQVHSAVMLVKSSASAVTLFRELFSKLELVRPGATRFGTQVIMLTRFLGVKKELREMMISEQWKDVAASKTPDGKRIRELLLQDIFWETVAKVLAIMQPVYDVLRAVDKRSVIMGSIYGKMLEATEKVNAAAETAEDVRNDPEIIRGLNKVMEALCGDVQKRILLQVQLAMYHRGAGQLGGEDARWAAAVLVESGRLSLAEWWSMYGGEVPVLQNMAVKVLSQPVTASEVERCWSAMNRVQRRDRNRLNAQTMIDVTWVAFSRRSRAAFDKDTEVRTQLFADLAAGKLKENPVEKTQPQGGPSGTQGEEEDEGVANCAIDWEAFGSSGRKKKKASKSSQNKRSKKNQASSKGTEKVGAEEEVEEEEAECGSDDSAAQEPKERAYGSNAWDISDGDSGSDSNEASDDEY